MNDALRVLRSSGTRCSSSIIAARQSVLRAQSPTAVGLHFVPRTVPHWRSTSVEGPRLHWTVQSSVVALRTTSNRETYAFLMRRSSAVTISYLPASALQSPCNTARQAAVDTSRSRGVSSGRGHRARVRGWGGARRVDLLRPSGQARRRRQSRRLRGRPGRGDGREALRLAPEPPRYGTAEATRFASWAAEVGRFSFTPPAWK